MSGYAKYYALMKSAKNDRHFAPPSNQSINGPISAGCNPFKPFKLTCWKNLFDNGELLFILREGVSSGSTGVTR